MEDTHISIAGKPYLVFRIRYDFSKDKQSSLEIHLTEPEKAEAEGQACSKKTAQDSRVELPVSAK